MLYKCKQYIFHPINLFILSIAQLIKFISSENYITIPFEIFKKNEPLKFDNLQQYFDYWEDLLFYGEISIGFPPKKIVSKISFEDFGSSVLNKGCLYNINEEYIPENSNTFKKSPNKFDINTVNNTFFYKKGHAFYANETFYFENDKNKIKVDNLRFIYSPDGRNKNNYICANFGLQSYPQNLYETSINLVYQLKKLKIISKYDYSIKFEFNNKNNKFPVKGILIIGIEPHNYYKNNYKENQIIGSGSKMDDIKNYFNFEFTKIYFKSPNNFNENIIISEFTIAYLIPSKGLIHAPNIFEDEIEKNFFATLINEKKCFKEYKNNSKFRTFVCLNNNDVKKEMKLKFPILKFYQKNYLYTFELDFDDLFKEKGDKIYFLIWFSYVTVDYWEIGYPFLKKYYFNYNYDDKLVYFCNNDLIENEIKTNDFFYKTIISIILLTVAIGLGFIIAKKIFRNKKQINSKDLELEFNSSLYNKM